MITESPDRIGATPSWSSNVLTIRCFHHRLIPGISLCKAQHPTLLFHVFSYFLFILTQTSDLSILLSPSVNKTDFSHILFPIFFIKFSMSSVGPVSV